MYYKIINKKKKKATMVADMIGYALWIPLNLFVKKDRKPTDIKEILIIRTAYIGDVVMALPILRPLKELYSNARITFLTGSTAKEVLENNPYVDKILTYDAFWFYPAGIQRGIVKYLSFRKKLRSRQYDLVIEARGDIRDILFLAYCSRSRYRVSYNVGGGGYLLTHIVPFGQVKHRVEYHLDIIRFLGGDANDIEWGVYLSAEERDAAKAILVNEEVEDSDLVVAMHPAGRKTLKCWSLSRFGEVAKHLISEYGAKVVFTGSREERALVKDLMTRIDGNVINLAGRTTLRLLAGLMQRFSLFVCNDSAPMHIAAAMKTPTVAIFGPSKSWETGPYRSNCRVIEKDFPCRFTCDESVCKNKVYHACMKAITAQDVFKAAKDFIG